MRVGGDGVEVVEGGFDDVRILGGDDGGFDVGKGGMSCFDQGDCAPEVIESVRSWNGKLGFGQRQEVIYLLECMPRIDANNPEYQRI